MKLKHAILANMNRDTLKVVVDDLEIEGVDRCNAEEMESVLSRSHRATPEILIEYLYEDQVKEVCERVGVDFRTSYDDPQKKFRSCPRNTPN